MSLTSTGSRSSSPTPSEVSESGEEMRCGQCEQVISPKKHAPRCCACKRSFHGSTCVPVAVDSWKKWGDTRRRVWQCPPCKAISDNTESVLTGTTPSKSNSNSNSKANPKSANKKVSGSSSQPPAGNKSTVNSSNSVSDAALLSNLGLDIDMAALQDANQTPCIKNLNTMMMYLIREVSGINAKFDRLNAEVITLKATVKALSEENRLLKKNQTQSDEKHRISDYQRRLLNDYSRVDNLVLHGGPKAVSPEQSRELFMTVASAYGVELDHRDISICHPLPSKGPINKQICKFARREIKIKLFLASKRKRLTGRMLGWTGMEEDRLDEPVFVTEHLSPDTARLLAESKKKLSVAANGPFTHVWCKQGRVLLRCEGDRGRPLEVRNFIDIADIYNEAVANGFVPRSQPPADGNQNASIDES